jgi:hypothetical protein
VLAGRVSLHRVFGGSGGAVVVAGLLIEGSRVADCRRAGGRKCVAMLSGRGGIRGSESMVEVVLGITRFIYWRNQRMGCRFTLCVS